MKSLPLGFVALVLVLAALMPVWAGGGSEDRSESLQVVATTQIVGDVVRNVSGDRVELIVLMDQGENPHSYQATVNELRAIEDADLVFINGFGLEEGLIGDLEPAAGDRLVVVSQGIVPIAGGHHDHGDDHGDEHGEDHDDEHDEDHGDEHDEHDEDHGDEDHDDDHDDEHGDEHDEDHEHGEDHDDESLAYDPHVWIDPNNVMIWADNIAAALSSVDRSGSEFYTQNAAAYRSQLQAVDAELRAAFVDLPSRELVVDHDAFAYFARAYDFETVATIIPGFSDASEPSVRDIAEVVETLRDHRAPAIFVGRQASPALVRLAEVISREVGRPIAVVPLLTGTLAPSGEPGDTYLGFLRYNADQLIAGLSN